MRYAFIEEHRPMWRLRAMCRALQVTKAGYFAWRNAPPSRRKECDAVLSVRIKAIHGQFDHVYGSPRIQRELHDHGIPVSRKRVARLMREAAISAKPARRYVVTTDSKHDRPIAENLLAQDFSADRPNQRWVTDITYVPTHEGWLFLAAVMDLYSRRIVGWAMDATMTTRL